jgi:hypothetical protein
MKLQQQLQLQVTTECSHKNREQPINKQLHDCQ